MRAAILCRMSVRPMSRPAWVAALLLCVVPAFGAGAHAASAPATSSGPPFTPCQLEHPQGILTVAADCTTIKVPEDYSNPTGRQLDLFVARVPALSRRKQP